MNEPILNVVLEGAWDLRRAGLIDQVTLNEFAAMCTPSDSMSESSSLDAESLTAQSCARSECVQNIV